VPCRGCILVVDDDPIVRDALAESFACLGCKVITAEDGISALDRLGEAIAPCLILFDLNMPRLDGPALAAAIRGHPDHHGIPLISMSAGSDRLGPPLVECHHSKPFEFCALMPSVEAACQDRSWLAAAGADAARRR
jgi:CheY-like chemotaxis protein